jgi:DNA-binding beta-propeller fold protein YncE
MCLRARAATVTLFFQLVVTAFVTAASLEINAQNALVTTIAGRAGTMACADGGGVEAGFNRPWGLATDGSRIFVADTENNTIRMVDPASRTVSTLMGLALVPGEDDGDLAHARLSRPVSLLYHEGSLYVGEAFTGRIRRIDGSKGAVSTVVKPAPGRTALDGKRMTDVLCSASAMVIVGNTLYATDPWCDCVRAVDLSTGTVTTFAGSPGKSGSVDGARAVARFTAPEGLAMDGKSLYVSDSSDSTVRKIDIATGAVTTIAGSPGKRAWVDGKGTVARFEAPWSLLLDGRTLYVGQSGGVRAIDLTTMAVTTLAGSPTAIFAADGPGREAHFINCTVIVRIENAFYVMDTALGTLRRIARDPPDVSPQEVGLTFHAKGGRALVAPFETRGVDITRTKPAFVKRAPPITSPWWGVIIAARGGLAPGEMEKCSYAFAVDETPGREPVLYFDTNRNGDLTDDPPRGMGP